MHSSRFKAPSFWVAVTLVFVSFGLALTSARSKSATFDEDAYIGKGTAIWLEGNYWLRTDHPALGPMIGTLLLLTEPELSAPIDHPCWPDGTARSCGRELLFYRSDTRRVLLLARFPIICLTAILVALVYRWAAELYGQHAALLSATLCALDPNLLAHGRLLTLDLATAFFVFLSCWAFYRLWAHPGWGRLAAVGLALGATASTRFTAGFLVPLFLALSLAQMWRFRRTGLPFISNALSPLRTMMVASAAMAMVMGIAAFVIWTIHGADFGPVPRWDGIRLPAPAYFNELAALLEHWNKPRRAFLLGRHYQGGWWPYFIVAFLIKTPLPTILILGAALARLIQRQDGNFGEAVPLVIASSYLGLSLFSSFNLGYRYLLPMLPLLFVFAGRAVCEDGPLSRLRPRLVQAALLLWLIFSNLAIYPHYLAYFNELVSPRNGYRALVDSNLDWGQDLPALEKYVEEHHLSQIYLSWFGESRPWQYDIPYRAIPSKPDEPTDLFTRVYHPDYPPPGIYAISATNLQALLFDDKDVFAWFLRREPVAQPGYSILIYEVPRLLDPDAPPVTVVLGGLQIDQVPPAAFEALWHTNDLRLRWFDPDTSCILPAESDAWYVVKAEVTPPWCPFWEETGSTVRLPTRRGDDRLDLYRLQVSPAQRVEWLAAVSSASPFLLSEEVTFTPGDAPDLRQRLSPPVHFGDRLEFLGYQLLTPTLRAGEEWAMVTYWRALADDGSPLKMFVHLLDDAGNVRCQHDGLDVPPIGWQAGDLVVQYHTLSVPASLEPGRYWVQFGVYDARTVTRLPVVVEDEPVGTRLLLYPMEVH